MASQIGGVHKRTATVSQSIYNPTHLGISKTKVKARSLFLWPSIYADVRFLHSMFKRITNYTPKGSFFNGRFSEYLHNYMDFLAFKIIMLFLIIDRHRHTEWIEVFKMSKTTTEKSGECSACFDIRETIVSENGPQFAANELKIVQ